MLDRIQKECLGHLILLVLVSGCDHDPFPPLSNRRMAQRLRSLQENPHPEENPLASKERIELCRRRVAQDGGQAAPFEIRMQLCIELLRAGETSEAIGHFERLLQLLEGSTASSPEEIRRLQSFLGIAWLRLGEQENCLARHGVDSCIFPLKGGGIHVVERGARAAIDIYRQMLAMDPGHLEARWLLNVASMAVGEYPDRVDPAFLIPPEKFASERAIPRFYDVAGPLGLGVVGLSGGCVVDDLDNDGFLDVVCSSLNLGDPLRYFHSVGDGGFSDWTEKSGLSGITGGLNLVHADYDNDGFLDLLVLRGAWLREDGRQPCSLLRNRGGAFFEDVTEAAGLLVFAPTQTAAFGDFDNDGHLDLFIGRETSPGFVHRCELYHNDRDGSFTEVSRECGLDIQSFVKGCSFGDFDNDGWLDLFVSCMGQDNLLFRNESAGVEFSADRGAARRFREMAGQAGVQQPRLSFPSWFFDFDNDGWQDLFVGAFVRPDAVNIGPWCAAFLGLPHTLEGSKIFRNEGEGRFRDVSPELGVDRGRIVMGANFGDLDNDGFLDFYLGTGDPDYRTLVPNRMFLNDGGDRFLDVTTAGGFGHLQKGHGIAFADVDNDGDQDVYEVLGGAITGDVFQNVLFENPGFGNHWITLQLRGRTSNRCAIGARIRVGVVEETGARRAIHVTVGTGGSFGSSSLQQEIGLGKAMAIEGVDIRWPSGSKQRLEDLEMDRCYEVVENEAAARPRVLRRIDLSPDS